MAAQKRGRRGTCITMMLAPEEKAALRAAASAAGMGVSTFIRALVMAAIRRGETITVARANA
jgi:hypothetical protein